MSDAGAAADVDLVAALDAADVERRRGALERFIASPRPLTVPVIAALVRALDAPEKAIQRRVADAFCAAGGAARPDVLVALRVATADPDPRRRWGATFALGRLDVAEPAMLPALVEALASPDGDQRWAAAAIVLACAKRHPETVATAMLELARGAEPAARKMALYVFRDLDAPVPARADAYLVALGDGDAGVRLAALSGLCRVLPPPPSACERVLRLVREDPDAGVRRAAVSALGAIGDGVPAAEEALDRAAASDDAGVRRAAEIARRRRASPTDPSR